MGEPGSRITQTAGIEGNLLDRPVFGSDFVPNAAVQWPVRRDQVDGGVADGLEKGAILALYENPNAKDGEAFGHARVIEASATEAKIAPLREYPCPVVDGNVQCRDGGAEIVLRARYARLLEPPLDFAFVVSPPRFLEGTPDNLRARAAETFAALRAGENRNLRGRVRFDDAAPDFVWWVTGEGFRIAPSGNDPSKLDTGAAVDLTGNEPLDELKTKTERILLRAYRVERLRRLSAKDAESASAQARLKVGFGAMPLAYDDNLKKCAPGPQSQMTPVDGALVANPCSRIRIEITNDGQSSRFVTLFLIDHDWNFHDICDQRGKDTTLAPRATRTCNFNYGLAQPGGSDFARYMLAILSTPERDKVAVRSFDDIMNLNNVEGAARAVSDQLLFDDGLIGVAEGTRAVDKNPATVTLVEWDLDHRARK
jgi:hypothetical protein